MLLYAALQKRPAGILLRASLVANALTQFMLWVALTIFFRHYLITLMVTEIIIWLVESALMYFLAKGQLNPVHAIVLSFFMNGASFVVGWFLPV